MKTIYATRINPNFPDIDEESIPAFMEITLVGDEMKKANIYAHLFRKRCAGAMCRIIGRDAIDGNFPGCVLRIYPADVNSYWEAYDVVNECFPGISPIETDCAE